MNRRQAAASVQAGWTLSLEQLRLVSCGSAGRGAWSSQQTEVDGRPCGPERRREWPAPQGHHEPTLHGLLASEISVSFL